MTRIKSPTTASLAAQPGGLPAAKTVKPSNKPTISKLGGTIGLNVFGTKGKENTWKFNGDKKKISANWRKYDLPPAKVGAASSQSLDTMLARAEQRNQTRLPDQARAVVARTDPIADQVGALEMRLNVASSIADTAPADSPIHATVAQLKGELAALRQQAQTPLAQRSVALRDIAADSIDDVRATADHALTAFAAEPTDATKAAYETARTDLVGASVQKFLHGYRTLNDHVSDQGRAKGMALMMPALARQLELPAKYLEGVAALEVAQPKLESRSAPGELGENRAAVRDALVGRRVRDLTAGRAYELPGPPPLPSEARHWQAEAVKLRDLGDKFSIAGKLLGDTVPALKERVATMQQTCMADLVAHLPALTTMTPAQRTETREVLGALAGKLRQSAGDTLHKDAALAPMQLMHIVDMAEKVTGGDPARCIEVYKSLANENVHQIIGATVAHLTAGEPASQKEQDLVAIWQMGAHQLPDAVSSLLAANPEHGAAKVDWRDVQTFFRCTQEHRRLSAEPNGDPAHKARMLSAMTSMRNELATGEKPAIGTPERRDWAMVKSAVWRQENMQNVVQAFEGFRTTMALPGTVVNQVYQHFDAKGRGAVTEEARTEFKQALVDFKRLAKATLARPDATLAQKGNAKVLVAMCNYMNKHRGTEKLLTTAKRKLTGTEGTFNSGREIWSNPLKAKDKKAILEAAGTDIAVARADAPLLHDLQEGHGALELLQDAIKGVLPEAERGEAMHRLATLGNLVHLSEGKALQGPEEIRTFLHDAIDRTALGDRTDTINAKQFKMSIPLVLPIPFASLSATVGGSKSAGTIVNVQANNDCVQLTLGRMSEKAINTGLGVSMTPEILSAHAEKALANTCLDVRFPGYSWKREEKLRTDPAVVLKFSIEPVKGLRDLDEARTQLKKAVDILVDWDPLKPEYRQYNSAYEALCDKLDSPFTIDDEVREYSTVSNENSVTPGRVAIKYDQAKPGAASTGKNDPARTGAGATVKFTVSEDKMVSRNQQQAREFYDTVKKSLITDVFCGLNTRHTSGVAKKKTGIFPGKKLPGVPVQAGATGTLTVNVGGSEYKDKKPVGTDKLKAYKSEYGDYSRDMNKAMEVLLEALPSVSNRVQEVVDKGFRDQLSAQLDGPAQAKMAERQQEIARLQAEIAVLQGRLAGSDPSDEIQEEPLPEAEAAALAIELAIKQDLRAGLVEKFADTTVDQVKKQMVDKELGKMCGEVLMNFVRALMENKTDRFSVKLESKQQWAHRGIDAAIHNAEAAGHHGMAAVMRAVEAEMFEGERDQSVKYLVAAGDMNNKDSQFNWKNPLVFKRRETKGMTEDPIPDTRTATLKPTADRLVDVRQVGTPLTALQAAIVNESLAEVRAQAREREQGAQAGGAG
ncbi:hypothetical protein [Massilia rhizosphaerae]|uniref:hypothetical protein n=1 Tax=Massilia rhizosphaerae TaxID=2784389 RepID=UPI0018DC3FF7|nr:hypothetical protein [Massilia rhizosphaerae]